MLATGGSKQGPIKVWEVATGNMVKEIETGGAVYTMDFDSKAKTIFASLSDSSVHAFDISSGVSTLIDESVGWGYHIWDVSPDGRFMAGPAKGGIVIWDQKTFRELRTLPGNRGGTRYVAFNNNGNFLASTGGDGVLRIWNTQTGELVSTPGSGLGTSGRVRFALDGRSVVTWGQDRKIHFFGPTRDGKVPPKLEVEQTPPIEEELFEEDDN